MKVTMDLRYHPVCHFMNGERLYFILVKATGDLGIAEAHLNHALAESGLTASSNAYLIFGNYDFVLRFWGDEVKCRLLEGFLRELRTKRELLTWRKLLTSR